MHESESNDDSPQCPRRFSQEQYDMLKRCSDKKDMTEWNEWRKKHPSEDILLEGAKLSSFYLKEVLLNTGTFTDFSGTVHLEKVELNRADLSGAHLHNAHMEKATLYDACLQCADLRYSYLEGTSLIGANLKRAILQFAHLHGGSMRGAHLEGASCHFVEFENTDMFGANLKSAQLYDANLKGAQLTQAHLEKAEFGHAIVDGSTLIWNSSVDRDTNFCGVGLDSCRIDPATKQLLEYNIRRKNWQEWYKEHPKPKWVVKPFWLMNDYGLSTARIILIFFGAVFIFANIYYHWGRIAPPGIIENLFEIRKVSGNVVVVPWWLVPLRAFYFSIITMTLGFSDMYANARSVWGHILITVQALLGYVLLAALVTRFAVLFTAGGPAGKFADEKKEKATESTERHRENR